MADHVQMLEPRHIPPSWIGTGRTAEQYARRLDKAKARQRAMYLAAGPELEAFRKYQKEKVRQYRAARKAAGIPNPKLTASQLKKHRATYYRWRRKAYSEIGSLAYKNNLCGKARSRARILGLLGTIIPSDLDWPTHCPVLGIELDYPWTGMKRQNHFPSLDRIDPTKGYVPGNVYVISYRANSIKRDATLKEIEKIAEYMRKHLG